MLTLIKDLSDSKACRQAVDMTVKHFGNVMLLEWDHNQLHFIIGKLDVLVNSAGILVPGSTESISEEDFDKCMNINCRSAFILTQASIPHLLESKGNIVHVSSVTGLR